MSQVRWFFYIARLMAVVTVVWGCSSKYLRSFDVETPEKTDEFIYPTRITAGIESNFLPELSPNGAFIIYTSDRSGNKDIWEKKINGGVPHPLTTHSADDFSPAISPNGERVAFVSRRADAAGDIHVIELGDTITKTLGSDEGTVQRVKLNASEDLNPAWFPDSERLVFSARKPGSVLPQLMMVSLDNGKPEQINNLEGEQPAVSSREEKLAFVKQGAVFLYDFKSKNLVQLTNGGMVQDGQPHFSPDGKHLLFIRYCDDTNEDGALNGDDKPSIWRIKLPDDRGTTAKLIDRFRAEPLTSGEFGAYSPNQRSPMLYFARQDSDSIDIFSLPESGQIEVGSNVDKVKKQLANAKSGFEILYILRRAESAFANQNLLIDSAAFSLNELEWMIDHGKSIEPIWLAAKIRQNFAEFPHIVASANLSLLELDIKPWSYPEHRDDLDDESAAFIQQKITSVSEIANQFKSADEKAVRVYAKALFVKAQALAILRRFGEANNCLDVIEKSAVSSRTLGKAALYRARLAPALSGNATAIVLLQQVVQRFMDDAEIRQAAAEAAIEYTIEGKPNPIPSLAKLKATAHDQPFLAGLAHQRMVDAYFLQGRTALGINELYEILQTYKNSPEILINAANMLVRTEGQNKNLDRLESALITLNRDLVSAEAKSKAAGLKIYHDFLLGKAERLMRDREPKLAMKQYRKILDDGEHINAQIGMIDALYLGKSLNEYIEELKKKLQKNPNSALKNFYLAYALTYSAQDTQDISDKLAMIDGNILLLEKARARNGQIPQVFQLLGASYEQKELWLNKYYAQDSFLSEAGRRWHLFENYFGYTDPVWSELAVDSYLSSYFLSDESSVERIRLLQNLGDTYYKLGNFSRSLHYYMKRLSYVNAYPFRDKKTEAKVYRQGGRAAFQIEDLKVAEALQRRALGIWEELGVESEIARALDALGLTLRERQNFEDAIAVYGKLLPIQNRLRDQNNIISTLINLAYCNYQAKKYERALGLFDEADDALNRQLQKFRAKDEGPESIKLDLAGQGSLAKGFDPFTRKILVLTYRERIYREIERFDLALDNMEQKFSLMSQYRQKKIKGGADEKFYAEELSVLANNMGTFKMEKGDYEGAVSAYEEAMRLGKVLRVEGQKSMGRNEWLNYLNLARMQLRLADLNFLKKSDEENFKNSLQDAIDSFKAEVAADQKAFAKPLATLLSIKAQLNHDSGADNKATQQTLLNEIRDLAAQIPIPVKLTTAMLMTSDFYEVDAKRKDDLLQRQIYRKKTLDVPQLEWQFYASIGLWQPALDAVAGVIDAHTALKTPNERQLMRLAFEKRMDQLKSSANSTEFRYDLMRSYLHLVAEDLTLRVLEFSSQSQSSERLAKKVRPLTSVKKTSALADALGKGEAFLLIHNTLDGNVIGFIQTKDRLELYDLGPKVKGAWQQLVNKLASVDKEPINHIYAIPSGDFFAEDLSAPGKTISYLGAPDWLPALRMMRKLPKSSLGHLTKDGVANKKLVKLNQSLEFRAVKSLKNPSDPFGFNAFNMVHSDSPVLLSGTEPVFSVFHGPDLEDKLKLDYDFNLKTLARFNLPNTGLIVLANAQTSPLAWHQTQEDHYSWLALGMMAYAAQVPTLILAKATDNSMEVWQKFYEEIGHANIATSMAKAGIRGELIGYPGISPASEQSFALEKLTPTMMKAQSALQRNDVVNAVILYKEAYYYAKSLGLAAKANEILATLVRLNESIRDFEGALYFQTLLMQRSQDQGLVQDNREPLHEARLAVYAKDFSRADLLLNAVETAAVTGNSQEDLAEAYELQGENKKNQRQYPEAIAAFEKSRKAYLAIGKASQASLRLVDMNVLMRDRLNQYDRALDYLQKAAAEFKKQKNTDGYRRVLQERAEIFVLKHDFQRAVRILRYVRDRLDQKQQNDEWLDTTLKLAEVYAKAGLLRTAQNLLNETVAPLTLVKNRNRHNSFYFDLQNTKAMLAAKKGDLDLALKIWSQSLFEAKNRGLREVMADSYRAMAQWQSNYGFYADALLQINASIALDEKLKADQQQLVDELTQAGILFALEDRTKALEIAESVVNKSHDLGLAELEAQGQLLAGQVQMAGNFKEEAAKSFASSIAMASTIGRQDLVIEAYIAQTQCEKALALIEAHPPGLSDKAGFYNKCASKLIASQDYKGAWELLQRAKARAFADATLTSFIASKTDLSLVQSNLAADTSLIEYRFIDQDLYVWVVQKEALHFKKIGTNKQDLQDKIKTYAELMESYASLNFVGNELASILIAPVAKFIEKTPNLVLIPDEYLQRLSFAALPYDKDFMIDRFQIAYGVLLPHDRLVADADVLPDSTNVQASANSKLADKPDSPVLTFVNSEVEAIKRFYPVIELGNSAGIKTNVLHLAARGDFSDASPGDGAIVLNNKIVTVDDFLNAKFDANLVVLSAQMSATQGFDTAKGVDLYNAAIMRSGTRYTIANLWRYDDLTSGILVKRFYRALSEHLTVPIALQDSQLIIKKAYVHPAYWAGFKLVVGINPGKRAGSLPLK